MKTYSNDNPHLGMTLLAVIFALLFLCGLSVFLLKSVNFGEDIASDSLPVFASSPSLPSHADWMPVTVETNDSINTIADYFGISAKTLKKIYQVPAAEDILTHLKPGTTINFLFDDNRELVAIKYALNQQQTWVLSRIDQDWSFSILESPFYQRLALAGLSYYLDISAKQSEIVNELFLQWKSLFELQASSTRNISFTTAAVHINYTQFMMNQQLPTSVFLHSLSTYQTKWQAVKVQHSHTLPMLINTVKLPAHRLQPVIALPQTIHSLQKIHQAIPKTHLPNVAPKISTPILPKLTVLTATQLQANPHLLTQLQNIFKETINLQHDLKPTDQLSVLYDKLGNISLVNLTSQNQNLQAIRYTDSNGYTSYYSPNGRTFLQKPFFLSTPVKYKRISDKFSMRRLHPILHIIKPHFGIDYAASAGTPVHAISSGYISRAGWYGRLGNTVVIHHAHQYQTLYAHLNSINYHLKPGQWVNQGDVIGHVGSTGLATGPHLHFGIYKSGIAINPALVLPQQNLQLAVADKDLSDFLTKKDRLLTQLAIEQNHNHLHG